VKNAGLVRVPNAYQSFLLSADCSSKDVNPFADMTTVLVLEEHIWVLFKELA